MNNDIQVTIGFCVKNAEKTIYAAINSMLKQDFSHRKMELILVEGFSKDNTYEIIKQKFSNTDIKCKIFREKTGLGMARQIVVNNAAGKYILWVDGDMIIPENYVRKQYNFMEDHPFVAIAAGKYGFCLGEGIVADLENIVYVVDSVYGKKKVSKLGHLPGTEGSIFRTSAIRHIGGFDTRIKGAAEDTEVAYRLKDVGWELDETNEVFKESTRKSLVSLWEQYLWYGYGSHFISHKNMNMTNLWKMTPMAGLISGFLRCPGAYLLSHKNYVFLLPIHYTYKRIAWFFGFVKGHLDGYGHDLDRTINKKSLA